LLYNAPRQASIIANEECLLWKLDRETFNHIVKEAANKKRMRYEQFLTKVPILSTMEPYERSKLSDAFKEMHFKANDVIIKEKDAG
jgi:cAMP-dependent protein kinase regulator